MSVSSKFVVRMRSIASLFQTDRFYEENWLDTVSTERTRSMVGLYLILHISRHEGGIVTISCPCLSTVLLGLSFQIFVMDVVLCVVASPLGRATVRDRDNRKRRIDKSLSVKSIWGSRFRKRAITLFINFLRCLCAG